MGQPAIQISGPVRNRAPLQTVPASYPSPLEGVGVAICLLGLSIFTTLSTGAVLMYNFPVSYTHLDVYKRQMEIIA